jgi:hypothetical protein
MEISKATAGAASDILVSKKGNDDDNNSSKGPNNRKRIGGVKRSLKKVPSTEEGDISSNADKKKKVKREVTTTPSGTVTARTVPGHDQTSPAVGIVLRFRNRHPKKQPVASIQHPAAPSVGNIAELEQLVFMDLNGITRNFSSWPIQKLRAASRTNLVEVVGIMKLVRRTREAQLVVNKYVEGANARLERCFNGTESYYRSGEGKRLPPDDRQRLGECFSGFLSKLEARMFNDGREVDYPLNVKRATPLGPDEKIFARDSFKHRTLFETDERNLTLSYNGNVIFTLHCRDLNGEDLSDFIRFYGGRFPAVLASYVNIYLHHAHHAHHDKIAKKTFADEHKHALMANRELLIYRCTPSEQFPRALARAVKDAMEVELSEHLGPQIYHPSGEQNRISTEDVFSVLLDLVQLLLMDRNPNNGQGVWQKLRSLYDDEWCDPTSSSSSPDEKIKSTEHPKRRLIASFISQDTQNYSTEQRYLYETTAASISSTALCCEKKTQT